MRFKLLLATLSISLCCADLSRADVVVRDSETSEDEFQAQAMAHGHTPMATWLASDQNRAVSAALKEIFQVRLIDAQSAWVRKDSTEKVSPGSLGTTLNLFLDLESEADWGVGEREAFAVFAARKHEMDPLENPASSTLRSNFPIDVQAILLNGQEVARADFDSIKWMRRPTRVTLLSNVYAPATIKLSGLETAWPLTERRAWVTRECAQTAAPVTDRAVTFTILASDRCRDHLNIAPLAAGDRELIEKFGIDRLKAEPLQEPEKPKAWAERPWVWAAIGVLAVGAVVAIERNQNQSSVQPVARDGW